MKVKCSECQAETDIGPNCNDPSDTRYKSVCPLLHDHLVAKGGQGTNLECPRMRRVRDAAIIRHGHK
jgi:hypothetical protein